MQRTRRNYETTREHDLVEDRLRYTFNTLGNSLLLEDGRSVSEEANGQSTKKAGNEMPPSECPSYHPYEIISNGHFSDSVVK